MQFRSVVSKALVLVLLLGGGHLSGAQIPLIDINADYAQGFSSLANSGTSSTLPLGFAMSEPTYTAGNGSSATAGIKSYGSTGSGERALGSLSNSGDLFFGAEFVNNTGFSIGSLDISYVGEQWRRGANTSVDTLFFEFSLNASSLTDGLATWTGVSDLDFTSPQSGATGANLDGNNLANQSGRVGQILGLNINDGEDFWIRWRDVDIAGLDHGLAVDNFFLQPTAVPEPSTMILSLLGLVSLAVVRRRRKAA